MIKHRLTKSFVIAFIAVITACSFKTLYNQLDYLIPYYVEGMVSLNDVLEEKVEQRTLVLLNWHRNTQLKQYADRLHEIQLDFAPDLTEEKVLQHISALENYWQLLSIKLNEDMAQLLPLLDKVQQDELFVSIADKNEDFREDFVDLDDEQRIEKYFERTLDNYEKWLGPLTDDQERAVMQAVKKLVSTADLRLQRRHRWQRGIQDILQGSDDKQKKTERLRAFFTGFESFNDDTMKVKTDTNKRVFATLTVHIAHSITQDQKVHFIHETSDYIRMFTELAENR